MTPVTTSLHAVADEAEPMTSVITSLHTVADEAEPFDWPAAIDEMLRLGLAWVDCRLDGADGKHARAAFDALRTQMAQAGQAAGLDWLAERFGLSRFEEDVLLIALAPEIDAGVAQRYAAAQGGTAQATPGLIARLLFDAQRLPVAALASLGPDGVLRRYALIASPPGGLSVCTSLVLPERVRAVLLGIPAGAATGTPLVLAPLPARLAALVEHLVDNGQPPLRLQLVGPQGSGRRALAAAVLAALGFAGRELAGENDLDPPQVIRDAVLDGAGLVLSGADAPRQFGMLDRHAPVPVIIVAEHAVAGSQAVPVLRLPALSADERLAVWSQASERPPDELAALAEHFALGPDVIAALAGQPSSLWAACREFCTRDLEEITTKLTPARGWSDLVLAPEVMARLHMLASQVTRRAEVYRAWGYGRLLGQATGISALFAGPSGVGKTVAAEALAHALSLDLHIVDLARVTSKFIGETEKNLSRVFDAAEAGGCVLLFDEADALFGKRSEVKDSHDRYANAEISYLLQRMERFQGLTILATNLKSHLDTAFLRRIRVIVDFPVPDVATRLALWRRALPTSAPLGDIDLVKLARHDLTGGNIVTVAANAAFSASAEGTVIEMRHLLAALKIEYRKLDRDASGLEHVV